MRERVSGGANGLNFIYFLSIVRGKKTLTKYSFDHLSFEDVNLALFFAPSQPISIMIYDLWPQYSPRVAPIGQLFVPSPETSKWPIIVITTCLKNIPEMRQIPRMVYYFTHSPLKLAF